MEGNKRKQLICLIATLLALCLLTFGLKSCDSSVRLSALGTGVHGILGGGVDGNVDADAKKVDDLINGIKTPITLESAGAIGAARAAYDALSDAAKGKVSLLDKLKGFEADLAKLQGGTGDLVANNAADLDKLLSGLKFPLDADGIDLLGKIRAAFDKLSPEEKAKFNLPKLEGLELAANGGAAELDKLLDGINLPITADSADLLAKIRAGYDALSDEEKAKFKGLDKLTGYEADLANLAANGPDAVVDLIKGIPAPITLNSEDAINKALAAYNALSDADKAKVSNYNLLQDYLNQLNTLKSSGSDLPKTGVE